MSNLKLLVIQCYMVAACTRTYPHFCASCDAVDSCLSCVDGYYHNPSTKKCIGKLEIAHCT